MRTQEIIIRKLIRKRATTPTALAQIKRIVAKKYGVACPSNSQLIAEYHKLNRNKSVRPNPGLEYLLRKRKIRSLSGVAVVSVLTRPYPCGGKCLYCPAQPGFPKSYLNGEPAATRAHSYKYDPYKQVQSRIKTLEANGHPADKVDLRIIGGTWSYNPKRYQTWFIKRCFEACNEYGKKPVGKSNNLQELQQINENVKHRMIGLNIETRPDCINAAEVRRLRMLGITHVELGVQTVYNDILQLNQRGHKIDAVMNATKILKDAGFKICYHMMPNLPGSTSKKDVQMFKDLFSKPKFQPDHLKIYPCSLLKEAPLYWIKDKIGYKPYSAKKLVNILGRAKQYIPYYCRIQRIVRDIPADYITEGGTKVSNLRQVVAKEMAKAGLHCKCIRCHEIRENYDPEEKVYLFRQDYAASRGKEIFLSFENKNRTKLYSLLRLRVPSSDKPIFRILAGAALIREIHTYGQLHPIERNHHKISSPQHKGLGKKLMAEAEKIARKEFGIKKIAVISGVGTRNYYRKLGYKLEDTYMTKKLRG